MTVRTTRRREGRTLIEALTRIRQRRSVILGYHGVSDSSVVHDLSRLQVRPARFRLLLEAMLAAGFRFTTAAALARTVRENSPPVGMAVLSFDDGMRNNCTTALPILDELEIPATVYVTTGFIGGWSPWIGLSGDGEMLTEADIGQLHRAGWEIGAHTVTHPDLSTLSYEECAAEVGTSKTLLERITGAPVETFAYPFGRYGGAALTAVSDAGFLGAVTTGRGSWTPFEMTRAMMSALEPTPFALLKMCDRYEPLFDSRPLSLVRARSQQFRRWLPRLPAA
jgi:peptidoglycan/xylan/chitin deacetylase (PgdA/CDA1 family)